MRSWLTNTKWRRRLLFAVVAARARRLRRVVRARRAHPPPPRTADEREPRRATRPISAPFVFIPSASRSRFEHRHRPWTSTLSPRSRTFRGSTRACSGAPPLPAARRRRPLRRPKIHVDRTHVVAEANDKVAVEDRGWQQALESIYPLKINEFVIRNGEITYIEDRTVAPAARRPGPVRRQQHPQHPLARAHVSLRRADERPHLRIRRYVTRRRQRRLPRRALRRRERRARRSPTSRLDPFRPVVERYNLSIDKGRLSLTSNVEFSPKVKTADVSRPHDPRPRRGLHQPPGARRRGREAPRQDRRGRERGRQRARHPHQGAIGSGRRARTCAS